MTPKTKKLRRISWLVAIALTAIMFVVIAQWMDLGYDGNDDSGIVRAFMGYETGTPATFQIYIHGLLALPLHWISCAVPGVAWFSWLQLALLALSCVVCAKSIMQCFVNHQKPLWMGAIVATVFLLVFTMRACTRLNFTQTSALLGAAAVCQMLSIDFEGSSRRGIVWRMLGAAMLVALSYSLRQDSLLPVLAFCGAVFVFRFMKHYGIGKNAKQSPAPMLLSLGLVAALMVTMLGTRALEIHLNDAGDYMRWQEVRAEVMDYDGVLDVPPEILEEIGWSDNTRNMVGAQWFFLDGSITTEAFQTILDYTKAHADNSFAHHVQVAQEALTEFYKGYPGAPIAQLMAVLCVLLCIVLALVQKRREYLWALLGAVVLLIAMCAYLLWLGRLPLRAVMVVLTPFACIGLCLLPACLPEWQARKALSLLSVLVLVLGGTVFAFQMLPTIIYDEAEQAEYGDPMGDLYEYARSEPDMLFICDLTLVGDQSLFPNMSDGIPHNITSWGGWSLRSKENIEQFANWGIDLLNFSAEEFLREDVCLASGVIDPPPNYMLNYLHEKVDPAIDWNLYGEYGYVYFFQFY